MEQSLADLLSDAFSEASVPSFPDGDLDFENLNFDEKLEDNENLTTKEDEALHQEAACQTAVLSCIETNDINMADNVDEEQSESNEEDVQGVGVMSMGKTPEEEDYTSSGGDSEDESSVSGEDEEDEEEDKGTGEKPGELLMATRCGNEFCDGDKEDRIFAEGQPLAPEGAENPQVRNEEQEDGESDEEVSYIERVPKRGSKMMIKEDEIEEDEEEREEEKEEDSRTSSSTSDSECEGMKIEQEENVLGRCFEQEVENTCGDAGASLVGASLEFPEISVQNLQDLIAEVDSEEKMKDFSGEEHQEAGESFADYPSDFSSCEYVEGGGKTQESNHQLIAKQDTCLERAVTDITWTGRGKDSDEDEYLYSIDLEVDADKFRGLNAVTGRKDRGIVEHVFDGAAVTGCDDEGETGEGDSYSSNDDEVQVKRSDEELLENARAQDLENNKQLEELHSWSSATFTRWSTCGDDDNRADRANFNINWNLDVLTTDSLLSEDLLTTEDTDKAETLLSDVTPCPAEDLNRYSVVEREDAKTTSSSDRGSLDDSFFFNTELEASEISELGQLGDDECEEERYWEQEQERIKAFYEFYNDSDGENGREGRQVKVKFCTDPLSQVICYETDSSDRDSLSSSTDGEEDLSSETSEGLRESDDTTQLQPACDLPHTQPPEDVPDLSNAQTCTRKHKCLSILKMALKMAVVIVMGLLMFWLATDQAGWLSHVSFF